MGQKLNKEERQEEWRIKEQRIGKEQSRMDISEHFPQY